MPRSTGDLEGSFAAGGLRSRKRTAVRSAIWDAAIDLFGQNGFEDTTIEEIAQAAGVSRRSFFRYFSTKDDLMAQGIVTYGESLSQSIRSCPSDLPLLEVLHRTVLDMAQAAASHPRTRKIMKIATSSPAAREAQQSRVAEVEEKVARAYAARCKSHAKQQALTAELLAVLTLAILDLTFRLWFRRGSKDVTSTVEQVFLNLTRLVGEPPRPKGKAKKHV